MASRNELHDSQDQVLEAVREGQEAVVKVAQTWADTVVRLMPDLSSFQIGDQLPSPAETVDAGFEFTERLLATQRRFARDLFGVTEPALRVVEDRAPRTASAKS